MLPEPCNVSSTHPSHGIKAKCHPCLAHKPCQQIRIETGWEPCLGFLCSFFSMATSLFHVHSFIPSNLCFVLFGLSLAGSTCHVSTLLQGTEITFGVSGASWHLLLSHKFHSNHTQPSHLSHFPAIICPFFGFLHHPAEKLHLLQWHCEHQPKRLNTAALCPLGDNGLGATCTDSKGLFHQILPVPEPGFWKQPWRDGI